MLSHLKPEILGLVETKCSGDRADTICKKLGFDRWVRIEALGYSGGVCLLWKDTLHIDIIKTHPQLVHTKVSKQGTRTWYLSMVYGSPNPSLRKFRWQDLNHQIISPTEPWIAVGDINSIVHAEETSNPGKLD